MIKRRTNFLGQQRLDVPLLRAAESSVSNDFDVLAGKIMAGDRPLVVRGFSLAPATLPIAPTSLQLLPAGGAVLHPAGSEPGTIFSVASDAAPEMLASTNARVSGAFAASATNYVGIDFRRQTDDSTVDVQKFLNATTLQEISESVALAITLDYFITISTLEFSATPSVCPIATVITDGSGNATSIVDARNLLGRLGSGGSSPSAIGTATWPQGRTEAVTPFTGGDRAITSLKGSLDAIMYRLWEIGGGQQWFSAVSDRDLHLDYGQPVLSNGDNFDFNSGTSTISWGALTFQFANSPVSSNKIADGSAVIADGQCLYVDIDRANVHDGSGAGPLAALVPAVADLLTMGSPTTPGTRVVLAWRKGAFCFSRDKSFEVGRTFTAATVSALGLVQLSVAPGSSTHPLVIPLDANNQAVNAAGGGSGIAFDGTGSGSGTGVRGQGGGVNGVGVTGLGGGGLGIGVLGTGSGTGSGVKGIAASTGTGVLGTTASTGSAVKGASSGSGPGVTGDGTAGTGIGGVFTGGAGAAGVTGTGGTGDTGGVAGTGRGVGSGVSGVGGTTDGSAGGSFASAATNGLGVSAFGAGTGHAVVATATGSGLAFHAAGGDIGFDTANAHFASAGAQMVRAQQLGVDGSVTPASASRIVYGGGLQFDGTTATLKPGSFRFASGAVLATNADVTLVPTVTGSGQRFLYLSSAGALSVSTTAPNKQGHDGTTTHCYVGSIVADGGAATNCRVWTITPGVRRVSMALIAAAANGFLGNEIAPSATTGSNPSVVTFAMLSASAGAGSTATRTTVLKTASELIWSIGVFVAPNNSNPNVSGNGAYISVFSVAAGLSAHSVPITAASSWKQADGSVLSSMMSSQVIMFEAAGQNVDNPSLTVQVGAVAGHFLVGGATQVVGYVEDCSNPSPWT